MAMLAFVFHHIHPMLGADLENCIYPPAPAVVPYTPYVAFSVLSGNFVYGPKMTKKSFAISSGISVMQQGTDCGYLAVPHFGNFANPLWPLTLLFSKSKSNFGCATVQMENKPVATAIPYVFGINVNCGTLSTPTGTVICPTTIFAGLTIFDLLIGVLQYSADLIIDLLFRKVFGSTEASNYLASRVLGRVWATAIGALLPEGAQISHELIKRVMEKIAKKIVTEGAKKVPLDFKPETNKKAPAVSPATVFQSSPNDTFGSPVVAA